MRRLVLLAVIGLVSIVGTSAAHADDITVHHARTLGRDGCRATYDSGYATIDIQDRQVSYSGPSASADVGDCLPPITGTP